MTHALFDDSDFKSLSNDWPQHKEGSHDIDVKERCVGDEIRIALFAHFLKAHEDPTQAANTYCELQCQLHNVKPTSQNYYDSFL